MILSGCKTITPSLAPGPSPLPPPAFSKVNLPLEIPRTTLDRLLNSQVPAILIQENNMSFGSGIEGDLVISRNGKISWASLDSQFIELKIPIQIQGEVGLKKSGLGSLLKSKFPINETLEPVIVIDPEINPDWSVGISAFELIDLGGNLKLEVLGMNLDLSDLLRKEINKWGDQYLLSNESLFSLKPLVDLAWAQAGKPFELEWEGKRVAFSIQPEEVRVNEFFNESNNYTFWLGLDGKIISHPADAAPSRAFPLPKLSPNSDGENYLDITIPISLTYTEIDDLLEENLGQKVFAVDRKTTMTPSNFRTQAYGELLGVSFDFLAEKQGGKIIEGKIFTVAKPIYLAENKSITFTEINYTLESENFGAKAGAGLKRKKILRSIEKRAVFPIGDFMDEGKQSIQNRLGLKTPIADLNLSELNIYPQSFYPTPTGLTLHLQAEGNVKVDWK